MDKLSVTLCQNFVKLLAFKTGAYLVSLCGLEKNTFLVFVYLKEITMLYFLLQTEMETRRNSMES